MDKQKLKIINRDVIKFIALIPMAVGHLIAYITPDIADRPLWMNIITYSALIAPPIFFFFITEGFHYTHSRKKYSTRLLIFALITQIPFCLANYGTLLTPKLFLNWNIITTLFLGLVCLTIYDSDKSKKFKFAAIAAIDILTFVFTCEWMLFGIPFMLVLYAYRNDPPKRLKAYGILSLLNILTNVVFMLPLSESPKVILSSIPWVYVITSLIAVALSYFLFTVMYSGKKGGHPVFAKWFFYIFYPAHLLAIWIIKTALN